MWHGFITNPGSVCVAGHRQTALLGLEIEIEKESSLAFCVALQKGMYQHRLVQDAQVNWNYLILFHIKQHICGYQLDQLAELIQSTGLHNYQQLNHT